jgi:elongation factor Ts
MTTTMGIDPQLVKQLREKTNAGFMDCKRALTESGGDLEKAETLLRTKGIASASRKSSRATKEGIVASYIHLQGKVGVLVEVNCETDFVAKNPDFAAFARGLAELVAKHTPRDVEALSGMQLGGESVESARQKLVQKIGENIAVRRFERIETAAKLAQYIHGVKIGVTVEYEGDDAVAKDVAMHIAFAKPRYLSRDQFPKEDLDAERRILEARANESGKPAEIAAKMVEGGIAKFLAENTLLGQPFVKDDKLTVEKMLAAKKTKLNAYRVLVVGEGIEKKSSDFAAEVMAQAGKAH